MHIRIKGFKLDLLKLISPTGEPNRHKLLGTIPTITKNLGEVPTKIKEAMTMRELGQLEEYLAKLHLPTPETKETRDLNASIESTLQGMDTLLLLLQESKLKENSVSLRLGETTKKLQKVLSKQGVTSHWLANNATKE